MSQRDNGNPKEPRRGRPTTGRDPVVAVRLPPEAIADVDRLARRLGLSSRSDAIRYMIIRSTASNEPREIEGGVSLGLPTAIRSKHRERFHIEAFVREAGKWRASIRRSDGSKVQVGDIRCDLFTTSVDTSTAAQALQLARKAIDTGVVQ
jgi:Arc/MetJ-type ribon-helix-helix transcriptional regulator